MMKMRPNVMAKLKACDELIHSAFKPTQSELYSAHEWWPF